MIAPLTKDGVPDMYNYMPARFVPRDEAIARKWPLFFEGTACRSNHVAPRYVLNEHMCVDCKRIKRGKEPLSTAAGGPVLEKPRPYVKTAQAPGAAPVKPLEPDALEKRFLVAYADTKDLTRAAELVGSSAAQIHMRLSTSEVFRRATNDLEERLQIQHTVPDPTDFPWDEDKRAKLITVYIDTGDLAVARNSIRVTPSQYYKELDSNQSFSARIEAARPLAENVFEEVAASQALLGNDKLLTLVLRTKKPEYREKVDMNLKVTETLTDEQLDNRLRRLAEAAFRRRPLVIEAECVDVTEPPREIGAVGDAGGDRAPSVAESHLDLL